MFNRDAPNSSLAGQRDSLHSWIEEKKHQNHSPALSGDMSQSIPEVKDRLQYKYHVELDYFLIIRAADVKIRDIIILWKWKA